MNHWISTTYAIGASLSSVYLFGYAHAKERAKPYVPDRMSAFGCALVALVLSAVWPLFFVVILFARLYGAGRGLARAKEVDDELAKSLERLKARTTDAEPKATRGNHD